MVIKSYKCIDFSKHWPSFYFCHLFSRIWIFLNLLYLFTFGEIGERQRRPWFSRIKLDKSVTKVLFRFSKFVYVNFTDIEAKEKQEKKRKATESDNLEFPNKKRNMVLAGAFAITVMVVYAFASGLISLEVVDDDDPLS